jgi:hypothetical protein
MDRIGIGLCSFVRYVPLPYREGFVVSCPPASMPMPGAHNKKAG